MKAEDRDRAYLWDMREFAREALKLVRRINFERLEKDSMRRLALERALELLGEAARRVSADFQRGHPDLGWRDLIGQRNVLAHDYGEIDHRRLYDSARAKIPLLLAELDRMLQEAR
ncbi:MAG: HepT-like ribonuclease domain-containing protein [Pseudomonadota bacterium]